MNEMENGDGWVGGRGKGEGERNTRGLKEKGRVTQTFIFFSLKLCRAVHTQ